MSRSSFLRTLFCAAALIASLAPMTSQAAFAAKGKPHRVHPQARQLLPPGTEMRCEDDHRCCTASDYCCEWVDDGHPPNCGYDV